MSTVFDSSKRSPEELETFLEENSPTVLKKSDTFWISVQGPGPKEDAPRDSAGLFAAWRTLKKSGQPINHDTIIDLAKKYNYVSGKWLFYYSDTHVKEMWDDIARAVAVGQCGLSAKVSPKEIDRKGRVRNHVICVYSRDFTDEAAVYELEASIRRTGIDTRMMYKPDLFTSLSIYRNNKWRLRPVIYQSEFDELLRRSKVSRVR